MEKRKTIGAAYLAAPGLEQQLIREIGEDYDRLGELFLTPHPPVQSFWAQHIWLAPEWIAIESIGDAARKLKERGRNWYAYTHELHRRSELIREKLPFLNDKPKKFPYSLPATPMGGFCLVEPNLMLASSETSLPSPGGRVLFEENHEDPPSRAYLKLFEALAYCSPMPQPGERCLELGASPGGWTWVIAQLGAHVVAVDRAPLDPRLQSSPLITFDKGNAFAKTPDQCEDFDWIFSDIICYPQKLLDFVVPWVASGKCKNMICTIKFQGDDAPYEIAEEFARIPGSRVMHLGYNKHELTWFWHQADQSAGEDASL